MSPQPKNLSDFTNETESSVNIFFAIFIPGLSLFTVLGNVAIIVAFWKLPALRSKPGELLILNLALVDFSTGLITLPLWSAAYITPWSWPFGENGCRVTAAFNNITVHGSLFAIMTISVDRVFLVLMEYPKYLKIQSYKRVYTTIAACWIFAISTVIPQQAIWNYAKIIDKTAREINFEKLCLFPPRRLQIYSSTVFLCLYCLPVILLCLLSMAFLWLLHRRLKRNRQIDVHSRRSMESNQQAAVSSQNRYIKPAISLIAVVSAMAICMLPYCFYVIVIELVDQDRNKPKLLYALLLLQFCNACMDPIFYGMTQRKIRNFYGLCKSKNIVSSVM